MCGRTFILSVCVCVWGGGSGMCVKVLACVHGGLHACVFECVCGYWCCRLFIFVCE